MTARSNPFADFGQRLPTDVLDLLKALANGTPFTPAAAELVARTARGEGDRGIERLLPMASDHPSAETLPEQVRERLRLQHQKARARFMALNAMAGRIVSAAAAAGSPVLLLKGFALANSVYSSPAHRPMSDLDIAVPHNRYEGAARMLESIGFLPMARTASRGSPMAGVNTHALGFHNAAVGVDLDLHYSILSCSLWESADDGFWSEAVPIGGHLAPALTLAPEHHVLHAALHGYRHSQSLSVRWMIDSDLSIRKAAGRFRWELMEAEARRHRCGPLLSAALGYLSEGLGTPVPRDVLGRLAALPMADFDVAFFRSDSVPQDKDGLRSRLRLAWTACERQAGYRFRTPVPFVRQMLRRWGINSPAGLLRTVRQHFGRAR